MIEDVYLFGVVTLTWFAMRYRGQNPQGFFFDFCTTVMIMIWPFTLALCLCAEMKRKLMQ